MDGWMERGREGEREGEREGGAGVRTMPVKSPASKPETIHTQKKRYHVLERARTFCL